MTNCTKSLLIIREALVPGPLNIIIRERDSALYVGMTYDPPYD